MQNPWSSAMTQNTQEKSPVMPAAPQLNYVHNRISTPWSHINDVQKKKEIPRTNQYMYDANGQLAQHLYPFYINHEQCATKIRYVRDKRFSFDGTIQDSGLFGQNLFKEGGKYLTLPQGVAP